MGANFQPYPTRSGFVSLAVAVIFGAIAVLLAARLLQQSNLYVIFQLLVVLLLTLLILGVTLYWAITAFNLHYFLNRNGLIIHWGLTQQLIPFDSIEKIVSGKDLSTAPTFRGLNLAGLWLGWGELADYGRLKFHATAPLADSLLVVTPGQAYVISPRQPDNFFKAWQVRQSLGPTQQWPLGVRRNWPPASSMLADPLAGWLLGLAALTCLTLFGYLAVVLPDLPPLLPIHFNAFGRADRIADKSALLLLPAAGALVLLVNTLLGSLSYRWERASAYLLWGSTVIMQVCLWIAAFMIMA